MVEIKLEYQGDYHCEAVHGPSQQHLTTDAPKDNHGRGESFSPTDLLATSLGTCMATVMGIQAKKNGFDCVGTKVTVLKDMINTPVRRVAVLKCHIEFKNRFNPDEKKILETAARTCPVAQSLHPSLEQILEFVYPK